jgi:energy-coupling factor transport system permease protein
MNIQDITLGQYAPRKSVIHALDPRTKAISSFLMMVVILTIHSMEVLGIFFIISLILFVLSRLSLALALQNLKPFFFLFFLTFFFHCIFTDGRILWKVPYLRFHITQEGVQNGLFYTFRISILIILANLLTLTTSPMSLSDAFERFLAPFKKIGVPAHELAVMMMISLRFIPILIGETDRIKKAQLSRGSRFEGNLFDKIRSIIPILVPLFLSAFRRANDLALAMDARCYRGGENRTTYHILKFKQSDGIALMIVLLICLPALFFH